MKKAELEAQLKELKAENKDLKVQAEKTDMVLEKVEQTVAASDPVPKDFRKIIDEILNQDFGVRVESQDDAPLFRFVIVVPDKYSSASDDQKNMLGGHDLRPIVLKNADGPNGVKGWVEKVWGTFPPEVQSLIHTERVSSSAAVVV